MATTTVSDKGMVVIPPDLRERYGLRAGTRVHIVDYGDILAIVPSAIDAIGMTCGMLKGEGSLAGTFLGLRRAVLSRRGDSEAHNGSDGMAGQAPAKLGRKVRRGLVNGKEETMDAGCHAG